MMKHFFVTALAMLFTFASIAVFAIRYEKFNKNAFAIKCHWYVHTKSNIVQGHADSITETLFKTGLNWTLATDPTGVCIPVQYVCAICYDDSKYTLAQALNTIWENVLINGWQHGIDLDPSSSVLRVYITNTHLIP
jgi:hypothetical protein